MRSQPSDDVKHWDRSGRCNQVVFERSESWGGEFEGGDARIFAQFVSKGGWRITGSARQTLDVFGYAKASKMGGGPGGG